MLKGNSCCGEDEDNSDTAGNGCCKDEHFVLKSDVNFTIKNLNSYDFVKTTCKIFYISLPFISSIQHQILVLLASPAESPPPELQHGLIISTLVLRI